MKRNRIAILSIIIVFILSFAIIGIRSTLYLRELEVQISDRDILIEQLKQADSITHKSDSLQTNISIPKTEFMIGNKEITTEELIRYVNNLTEEIYTLKDSLEYYQTFYSLSKRNIQSNFSVKKDGMQRMYSFESNTLDIDTVDVLLKSELKEWVSKLNREYKRNSELKNKLNMYQKAINKYGIEFNNIKENDSIISYVIEAPKVDSALMLLPFYRKELKYDKKKKEWTINIK